MGQSNSYNRSPNTGGGWCNCAEIVSDDQVNNAFHDKGERVKVKYYDLLAPSGRIMNDEMPVKEHMHYPYWDDRGVSKHENMLELDVYMEKMGERDRHLATMAYVNDEFARKRCFKYCPHSPMQGTVEEAPSER